MRTFRDVIDAHAAAQPDAPFLIAPEPGCDPDLRRARRAARCARRVSRARRPRARRRSLVHAAQRLQRGELFLGAMYGGLRRVAAQPARAGLAARRTCSRTRNAAGVRRAPSSPSGSRRRCSARRVRARSCRRDRPRIVSTCRRAGGNAAGRRRAADAGAADVHLGHDRQPKGVLLTHANMSRRGARSRAVATPDAGRPRAVVAAALPHQRPVHRDRGARSSPAAAS